MDKPDKNNKNNKETLHSKLYSKIVSDAADISDEDDLSFYYDDKNIPTLQSNITNNFDSKNQDKEILNPAEFSDVIDTKNKEDLNLDDNKLIHQESMDDCIMGVIREENPQLFQYAESQLKKYSTSDSHSISQTLQLIGLNFETKSCKNIKQAKSTKHHIIALLDGDKYCIIKEIKDGFIYIFSTSERKVVQKIKLTAFEKIYLGRVLLINNIKGSSPELAEEAPKSYWLWKVINRYKAFYVNVLVAAFIINLFGLIIPLFSMNVYDRVIPNNSVETLWALFSGVVIIIVFDFILKMLRAFFVERTSKRIDLRLSSILFAKALHLFMKDQNDSVGVRSSRIKNFDSVRDFLSSVTLVGIIDFPFLIITLLVIYFIGGSLVIVPIVTLILAMILTFLINIPLHKHTQKSVEGLAMKNSLLFEALFNIETVKNFCMQPLMMNRWNEDNKSSSKALSDVRFLSTFIVNFTSSLGFLSSVLIVVLGTHLIWSSDLTTGGLIACSILSGRCLAPITQMTTIINRFQQVRCSLDALNNMMMMDDERKGIKEFYSNTIGRDIEFHDVSFAYNGQNGEFFKDISISIKEGEKVAILGNSGSGKSTLFKLICGLYTPNQGSISLSGINIAQIDPYILRSNIGYVEQSSRLFKGTLWSNLVVKNPKAKEVDVIKAIEISGVDSFAKEHPDGYNMKIEEAGVSLSGGQVQSVVIARALIGDPKIILLDEPTNFMDSRLENNFINKIRDFSQGKTMLISTHKRALLELVDRIIVVDQGKIVADNRKDIILTKLFK